ncbi:ribosomal protein S18-alanine N-acetyltransferase [Neisseriaceae bacterium B1]
MPTTITPATTEHLASLAALDAQCNPNPWTASQFQAALNAPHDTVLVAQQSQHIVGFIVWQRLFDEIELHLIATAPNLRRQGIASLLLAQLFQAACEHQVTRVLLEVRQSNQRAQDFYVAHGFQVCGQRKNYYGGTENAVLMEKLC